MPQVLQAEEERKTDDGRTVARMGETTHTGSPAVTRSENPKPLDPERENQCGAKTKTKGKIRTSNYESSLTEIIQQNLHNLKEPMAAENTINQAELKAIEMVVDNILSRNITENNITIKSDSQTTIDRLFGHLSSSKQLTTTIGKITALKQRNRVIFEKVKAHVNIEGNEIADALAKEAAQQSNNTSNKLGMIRSQIKNNTAIHLNNKTIKDIQDKKYNDFTTAVQTKLYKQYNTTIRIKDKKTLRQLTLAISGQNNLAAAQHKKDKKTNQNCTLCNVKENSEHVLLFCPDLDEAKHKLGYLTIKEEIYGPETLKLNKFIKLIKRSNRFH